MKSFATIVTLASLLFCLFSCDTGKSGPFTFTNTTEETVYVLIDQDGVLEKRLLLKKHTKARITTLHKLPL